MHPQSPFLIAGCFALNHRHRDPRLPSTSTFRVPGQYWWAFSSTATELLPFFCFIPPCALVPLEPLPSSLTYTCIDKFRRRETGNRPQLRHTKPSISARVIKYTRSTSTIELRGSSSYCYVCRDVPDIFHQFLFPFFLLIIFIRGQ